ncbi:hypothetical protein ILYODFUR_032894 [Ilyodon furcidens]|uniref:AIG1-type G domain-containing protein n=1 Tax=Ilyodon furcidens TaxID=33524 RepID=A0ABV0TRQ8_9TELE
MAAAQDVSELRVALLGGSRSQRSSVLKFILGEDFFSNKQNFIRISGTVESNKIAVINVPDNIPTEDKLTEFIQDLGRASAPGPHVFLLVLQPEDFTEEDKNRICKVLQTFSNRSFDHSLILILTPRQESSDLKESYIKQSPLKELIRKCRYRYLSKEDIELPELLTRCGQIIRENKGEHVSYEGFEETLLSVNETQRRTKTTGSIVAAVKANGLNVIKQITSQISAFWGYCSSAIQEKTTDSLNGPSLNLVLFGRRGAGKTSAAKAILGQTELHSASNSSECVRNQGQVCGRWVSLVELPALYGEAQQKVMEESFRCISLCDPEGVHAFILVLPVGPLTDEDKEELQTLQDTFSSRVNNFTMVLFTVESDPKHPAVVNFVKKNKDIQELCQSCGGRYDVLNIKDQQQIPELMEKVEKNISDRKDPRCFTSATLACGQLEEKLQLKAELKELRKTTVTVLV